MKGIAIIVAAGKGERAGVDKVWAKTAGKPIVQKATDPFFAARTVDVVLVAVRPEKRLDAVALFEGREKPYFVLNGGATRGESVRIALDEAKRIAGGEDAVVAIHDGARPYVTRDLIERAMLLAAEKGSAIPALPCTDSLRLLTEEGSRVLPREQAVCVQTPQCFVLSEILRAYAFGDMATDDAALYEKHVGPVTLLDGEETNKKITYPSDLDRDLASRVGVGYDVHPLVKGRPLILGGVTIPHDKGLDGHSDADALIHAIMDALLTAAGLPDIGHRFPPNDDKYKGANSLELLKEVTSAIKEKGFTVTNLSATVMAEKPKLSPFIPQMEKIIAEVLGADPSRVTIAATTTEKLGIVGEEKGIAAQAVVLLQNPSD